MNPTLQTAWADALESGEYPQGFGAIRSDYEVLGEVHYCALGVLWEVARKMGYCGFYDLSPYDIEAQRALGISRDMITHTVNLNDSKRQSLSEIAEWVRTANMQEITS